MAFFMFCTQIVFSQNVIVNVHGSVTDNKGSAISEATIIFTSLTNKTLLKTVTDDNGLYSLNIEITETSIQDENDLKPHDFILFQNYL